MGLPMLTLDSRTTRVCSVDPAVTLKFAELSDEQKAKGDQPVRQKRRPIRWLKPEDVEAIGDGAIRATYRPLADHEQTEITGGVAGYSKFAGVASLRAVHMAVTDINGIDSTTGNLVDGHTPKEIDAILKRWPALLFEPLGTEIIDDSMGFNSPLLSSE